LAEQEGGLMSASDWLHLLGGWQGVGLLAAILVLFVVLFLLIWPVLRKTRAERLTDLVGGLTHKKQEDMVEGSLQDREQKRP
jgi:ribose/xylose/arabinose/galactoside ABC-type transport system permease subunit